MKEYEEFMSVMMKMSVDLQRYEIAAWCREVKKELAYSTVFEVDMKIEDFVNICDKKMSRLGKCDRDLIVPHLRSLKIKILGI